MYKKAISILLAIVTIFCSMMIPVAAYNASDEESAIATQITPRFTTISGTTATIVIKGLNATVNATLMSNCSTNLKIVIELQKEKTSGYKTLETWTKSGAGTIISLEETRLINILSNYRIKVTYTAGSESTVLYKYPD